MPTLVELVLMLVIIVWVFSANRVSATGTAIGRAVGRLLGERKS